jgi:uncharacterized protein YndB with AHSA1/START domain
MSNADTLKITTPSDREIVITREFDAPRRLVFEAVTRPELLRRWLYGPDGWSLDVCEVGLTPGARCRYVWKKEPAGISMGMSAVCREVVPPERAVFVETFDEAWYPGDALVTWTFTEKAGRTTATLAILYESKEARDIALRSGMADGMKMGYDRLDGVLASLGKAR